MYSGYTIRYLSSFILLEDDCLFFVCFVALRPKSTAMVIAGLIAGR